jgi:hypothetical protein
VSSYIEFRAELATRWGAEREPLISACVAQVVEFFLREMLHGVNNPQYLSEEWGEALLWEVWYKLEGGGWPVTLSLSPQRDQDGQLRKCIKLKSSEVLQDLQKDGVFLFEPSLTREKP